MSRVKNMQFPVTVTYKNIVHMYLFCDFFTILHIENYVPKAKAEQNCLY